MIESSKRAMVVVVISMLIAAIHIFRLGSYLPENLHSYYYSYFSDFLLPFGCYFLLCVTKTQLPIVKRWEAKLAIAFLLPAIAETCQYFGIPILGVTFDPLDYFMYALGAILAAVVDTQVFSRLFAFWPLETAHG